MAIPGFVVLYRWRIKSGQERAFGEAWSAVTAALLRRGSLGSRLHQGDDGLWYGYAQWPSATTRSEAFDAPWDQTEASEAMHAAIAESFPEVILEIVADYLVS